MESMGPIGRLAEFGHPYDLTPPIAQDSRFGIRKLPSSDESPSILTYTNPGRGPNGESQS